MKRFTLLVIVRTVAFNSSHTPVGVALSTTRLDFATQAMRIAMREALEAQDRATLAEHTRVSYLSVDNVLPEA